MKIHLILSPFSNAGPIIEGVYFTPAFPFSLMHWSLLICYHDSLLQCDFFFFFSSQVPSGIQLTISSAL